MIYHVMVIDADSSILVLEKVFRSLKQTRSSLESGILAKFFSAMNTFIDEIQAAMRKGRDVSNMVRTLAAENSIVTMVYHPEARLLICAIADADDEVDIIISASRKIGNRFWKKHRDNLQVFRTNLDKRPFYAFIPDIEMLLHDGRIAEYFPELQIGKKTLQRINLMGVISDEEYQIGKLIDGKTSTLQISKVTGISRREIMDILKKMEDLDIIKKIPRPT